MNLSEMMRKKVAGIPIVYIALGGAAILAVVAWRMQPSEEGVTGDPAIDAGEAAEEAATTDPYDQLNTGGTVVVAPQQPEPEEVVEKTNDDWLKEASDYLLKNNKGTAGEIQEALTTYLRGEDLSYEQGQLRDEAVKAIGYPPEPLSTIGKTNPQKAKKQFTTLPGRHTVTGPTDNAFSKLALLYYGKDDINTVNLIQGRNYQYGNVDGPLPVGSVISLPGDMAPRMYTATSINNTAAKIAAVNGRAEESIYVLNDGMKFPVKPGTKVRVL